MPSAELISSAGGYTLLHITHPSHTDPTITFLTTRIFDHWRPCYSDTCSVNLEQTVCRSQVWHRRHCQFSTVDWKSSFLLTINSALATTYLFCLLLRVFAVSGLCATLKAFHSASATATTACQMKQGRHLSQTDPTSENSVIVSFGVSFYRALSELIASYTRTVCPSRCGISTCRCRASWSLRHVAHCLSNAIHCMGWNIKSLAACVCLCVCAHGFWRPNISKTVEDIDSVPMGQQ